MQLDQLDKLIVIKSYSSNFEMAGDFFLKSKQFDESATEISAYFSEIRQGLFEYWQCDGNNGLDVDFNRIDYCLNSLLLDCVQMIACVRSVRAHTQKRNGGE